MSLNPSDAASAAKTWGPYYAPGAKARSPAP